MADEKMNTPRESAIAVLAKAQKLLDKKAPVTSNEVKTEDLKKSAEYTSGLHKVEYYGLDNSKHTAQQAALAVLASAQDMLTQTISTKTESMQKSAEAESGMHKVEYYKAESLEKGTKHYGTPMASPQKGVHLPSSPGSGQSDLRDSSKFGGGAKGAVDKINEARKMPKPSLPKSENLDEKQDAQLGERVEHLCEDHMIENKSAERKEGHKLVQKSECAKCQGGMQKTELSDLYEDLTKMEDLFKGLGAKASAPASRLDAGHGKVIVKAENKESPSNPMKPRVPEQGTERDYNDFETKPGNAPENDHRQAKTPSPAANPVEQREGNNPLPGSTPTNGTATGSTPGTGTKGVHKLSFMLGSLHAKKMKKGIALS